MNFFANNTFNPSSSNLVVAYLVYIYIYILGMQQQGLKKKD